MSLEQRIEELTAAVIALTAAMGGKPAALIRVFDEPAKEKSETKKSDAVTEKTAPAQSAPSGEASASTAALSYDDVKKAIFDMPRPAAVALLQRYGAKTGKDLTEEQWAGFHADAQRVVAGEYDPTEGA